MDGERVGGWVPGLPFFIMTTSAYKNLTTGEAIFKDLVWNPLLAVGEKALQLEVPFLALPVVSSIFTGLTGLFSDWIFEQLSLGVDLTAIKLVNDAHQSAYDNASLQLKVIATEKGVNSPSYVAAKQKAMDALSKFTEFGS